MRTAPDPTSSDKTSRKPEKVGNQKKMEIRKKWEIGNSRKSEKVYNKKGTFSTQLDGSGDFPFLANCTLHTSHCKLHTAHYILHTRVSL